MAILKTILTVVFILICLALTVIILLQEGKSAGLGAIAGAADTYWGRNKGTFHGRQTGDGNQDSGCAVHHHCRCIESGNLLEMRLSHLRQLFCCGEEGYERRTLQERKKAIYGLICDELYVPMKAKEIAAVLNVPKSDRRDLAEVLDALVAEEKWKCHRKAST